MKDNSGSSVFKKYIASYILVFSIPFLAFLFIMTNTYVRDVRTELSLANKSYLEQSNLTLNEQLVEVRTLGNYINDSSIFNRLSPYARDEYNDYKEIIRQHEQTSAAVEDLYIVLNEGNQVFSSQGYMSLDAMFNHASGFINFEGRDEFEKSIFSSNEEITVHNGKLFYMMPLGSGESAFGTILTVLNTKRIQENIDMVYEQNEGIAFLTASDGRILLLSDLYSKMTKDLLQNSMADILETGKVTIEKSNYFTDKKTNDLTGWSFVSMIDSEYFYRPLYRVLFFSVSTILIIASIGITFALHFAKKNYQPIQTLAKSFKTEEIELTDEWDLIQSTIQETYLKVENLTSKVDQQAPIVRNALLLDLIKGSYESEESLKADFKENRIYFPFRYFSFAIIEFDEESMGTSQILQLEQMSQEISGYLKSENYHIETTMPYLSNNQLFLIINLRNEEDETWDHFIQRIQDLCGGMMECDSLKAKMGIGLTYRSYEDVKKSYIEAGTAVESIKETLAFEERILFFKDIEEKRKSQTSDAILEYPEKEVMLLLQSLKRSNYKVAQDILDEIFTEIKAGERDTIVDQAIISYLFNSVLQLTREMSLVNYSNYLFQLNNFSEIDLAEELLYEMSQEICEELDTQIEQENTELSKRIIDYIKKNYSSVDISLEQIASEYNISISYASKLIKEETDETFSTIIQDLRMEKFKELLVTTSRPIKYLVDDIGYLDASNFTRKFRKENGMTPGKYRKKYKSKS